MLAQKELNPLNLVPNIVNHKVVFMFTLFRGSKHAEFPTFTRFFIHACCPSTIVSARMEIGEYSKKLPGIFTR